MTPYLDDEYYRAPLYKAANDIYSLFIIGALIGWLTIPFGSFAAGICARRARADAVLRSHFHYQCCCLLWLVVSVGVSAAAAYYFWLSPHAAINQTHTPLANSHRVEIAAGFIVWFVALYILWFRRVWRGLRLLGAKKAIQNPWTPWLPR